MENTPDQTQKNTPKNQTPVSHLPVAKKLFKMLHASLAVEPVLVHLIAIMLGVSVIVLLHYPDLFPKLGKYHQYLINIMYGLILLQTIKSASKSLFIPVIMLGIAGVGLGIACCHLTSDWQFISFDLIKKLMLSGTIGIGTSIFVMR